MGHRRWRRRAVFLPATIVAGAVALGPPAPPPARPATSTTARCRAGLAGVITPGTSGILALVSAEDAPAVEAKMPDAEEVKTVPVDDATAGAIKEAAAEAETTAPSGT